MTHTRKPFPLLWQYRPKEIKALEMLACPRTVPWETVEPHRATCARNHGGQSLERLAERGGLCIAEMVAALSDQGHHRILEVGRMPMTAQVTLLGELMDGAK